MGYRQTGSGAVYKWEFTDPANGHELTIEPHGRFATNSDDLMASAALQGAGLVMHMDFAVRDHVASGRLIRVLEAWCPPFDGFQIYISTREQMPSKLRAMVDFFVEKRRHAEYESVAA